MPELVQNSVVIYSPASLIAIFSKAFIVQEEKKIIQVKGIYLQLGKEAYAGFYYDKLKDEASDFSITILTPVLIRNELKDNTTIRFNGFLTRKIDKQGRIEFQMHIVDLVTVSVNKFSHDDIKKIEIINSKLDGGIKDLDSLIKQLIFNNQKLKVVVIIGKSAIIDNDIKSALGASIIHYDLLFVRVSIASIKEISDEIIKYDGIDCHLICVARGGGELMEAFDKNELAQTILNRKKVIASAIGHADNVTLFEKVADKKFSTPTAFGTYLKHIYETTIEELSQSKAKLQKDITEQLKAIYDPQIKNLNEKYEATVKQYTEEKKSISELNESQKKQLNEKFETATKQYNEEKNSILALHASQMQQYQTNHNKQVADLSEMIKTLKSQNQMFSGQLAFSKKPTTPVGTIVFIVILIVIIIIFMLGHK